jgi:LysR family transcriptional activator of nhaA
MMTEVAALGHGWIPVHAAVADKVCRRYRLVTLGAIGALRDQFYLVTSERKMRQPAALAVASAGRAAMDGGTSSMAKMQPKGPDRVQ